MTKTELRQFKAKHKLTVQQIADICLSEFSTVCNWLYGSTPLKPIYEKALKDWEKKGVRE